MARWRTKYYFFNIDGQSFICFFAFFGAADTRIQNIADWSDKIVED